MVRAMPLATHLSELVKATSELIAQHVKLARAELRDDAKELGAKAGQIAVFVPFALLGYALLNVALALWLRRWLSGEAAFALVGAVNLAAGGLGIFSAVKTLQKAEPMGRTRHQLEASVEVVLQAGAPAAELTEKGGA